MKFVFLRIIWALPLLAVLLNSCGSDEQASGIKPVDNLPQVQLDLRRYEQDYLKLSRQVLAGKADCKALYQQTFASERVEAYSALFGENPALVASVGADTLDREFANQLCEFAADTAMAQFIDSVNKHLATDYDLKTPLEQAYSRLKHWYPDMPIPKIRTWAVAYDPRMAWYSLYDNQRVAVSKDLVVIGIEYFTSPSFPFFHPEVPRYIRRSCIPENIAPALMMQYARKFSGRVDPRSSFVEQIVFHGRNLYFVKNMVPAAQDSLLMNCTAAQMEWARANLGPVYREMLPLLFEVNTTRYQRWMSPGPGMGGEGVAPSQLGIYVGWQMVNAYMAKHPEVTIPQLMQMTDLKKIFQDSGFKPK